MLRIRLLIRFNNPQIKSQQKMKPQTTVLHLTPESSLPRSHIRGFNPSPNFVVSQSSTIYSSGKTIFINKNITNQNDKQEISQLIGHTADVTCFALSKDNKYLVSGQAAAPGNKNYQSQVIVWDMLKQQMIGRFVGLKEGVKGVLCEENNRYICGASNKNQLMIWSLQSGKQLLSKFYETPIQIHWISSNILTLSLAKSLHSLDLQPLLTANKPPLLTNFTLPSTGLPRTYTCLIDIGNNTFILGTESGELCVFVKGIFKNAVVSGKGVVTSVGVLGGAKEVIAAVGNEVVRFAILNNGQQLKQVCRTTATNPILHLKALPNSPQVLCLTKNTLTTISLPSQQQTLISQFHSSRVTALATHGPYICTIDQEGVVIVRILKNGKVSVINLLRMLNSGTSLGFGDSGIYAGFKDGKLVGFKVDSKKQEWEVQAHKGAVTTIYAKSKDYFLTGGQDCTVRIWSHAKQLINQISAHQKPISKVLGDCQSPYLLHSCSTDRSIQSYNLKEDKKQNFRQSQGNTLTEMVQFQNSTNLVTSGINCPISFWAAGEPQPYHNLALDGFSGLRLAFNQKSTLLAIGCDNGFLLIYDVAKDKQVGSVFGHSRALTGVAWVKDEKGEVLVTAGEDNCFAIWRYN